MNKKKSAAGFGIVIFQLLIVLCILTCTTHSTKIFGFKPSSENIYENNDCDNKHKHDHDHIYNRNQIFGIMSDQTPFTSVNEGSDHPKYRIGGFQTEVPNNQAALQGEFNLGTNPASDSNANANANEAPSETPSTTEPTADEKSEQDREREGRERRFKELVDSGIINLNQKDVKPGRQYTLPVVKPKLQ